VSHAAERREARAADGALIEYDVLGAGPPLVLLHGLLASRHVFSRQRDSFAARHRLVLISFRGHDGSDNFVPANYGVGASDVEDVLAVLDAEGIAKADLFAHSSGGATAFVLARRFPERVRRTVLIEPTLLALLPEADLAATVPGYHDVVREAARVGPEAALRRALDYLSGGAFSRMEPDAQAHRLQRMARTAPMVGPHMQGLVDLVVTEQDVREFAPPCRLYYGADSFPFEAVIADRFRALRPDMPVRTLERAGHNVHRDRPDILNKEVLAFLSE